MNEPAVKVEPASTMVSRSASRGRLALLIGVAALLVLIAVAAWVVRGQRRTLALAAEARAAMEAGRFEEVDKKLDAWLAESPRSAEAHFLKARANLALKRPETTIQEMARARELSYPQDSLDGLHVTILYRQGGTTPEQVEAILRRALDSSTEPMPEVAETLARIYLGRYRLDLARPVMERWRRDAPYDPQPYLARNQVDQRQDADPTLLVRNDREALKRDPNLARAQLDLAAHLREAHQNDESAEAYDAYLSRHPDDAEAHLGAAQTATVRNRRDDAIRHLDRALALTPDDPVALRERAAYDLREGRAEAARDLLRRAIARDPYDPALRHQLSQALKRVGDPAGARAEQEVFGRLRKDHDRMAELQKALARTPGDVALRSEFAGWLLSHGHEDEGKVWADQVLVDQPGHLPTLRLLIDHYRRKGDDGTANFYELQLPRS